MKKIFISIILGFTFVVAGTINDCMCDSTGKYRPSCLDSVNIQVQTDLISRGVSHLQQLDRVPYELFGPMIAYAEIKDGDIKTWLIDYEVGEIFSQRARLGSTTAPIIFLYSCYIADSFSYVVVTPKFILMLMFSEVKILIYQTTTETAPTQLLLRRN